MSKWQMIVSFGDERAPRLVEAGPGSRHKPIEIDSALGSESALAAELFFAEISSEQGGGGWVPDDLPLYVIPVPAELLHAPTFERVPGVKRVHG